MQLPTFSVSIHVYSVVTMVIKLLVGYIVAHMHTFKTFKGKGMAYTFIPPFSTDTGLHMYSRTR